eukprot:3967796-Pyramimonas_sp.AAC.1
MVSKAACSAELPRTAASQCPARLSHHSVNVALVMRPQMRTGMGRRPMSLSLPTTCVAPFGRRAYQLWRS